MTESSLAPRPLPFTVPSSKRRRVVVNTDAKCEADDQFAIVHALLSPLLDVRAIVAAHFGDAGGPDGMQRSYDEIQHLLSLMQLVEAPKVLRGASGPIPDEHSPKPSAGADAIIAEAMRDDACPLYCLFLGPITDLATAILQEPRIVGRLTAVWTGGGRYPDGGRIREFNMGNDIDAANVVFGSGIDLWQVPMPTYARARVSIAELAVKVRPYGQIGEYLFDQLVDFNSSRDDGGWWPHGESWALGDSVLIALLLDDMWMHYHHERAPIVTPDMHYAERPGGGLVRVYDDLDARFILEDMYAKLALAYG